MKKVYFKLLLSSLFLLSCNNDDDSPKVVAKVMYEVITSNNENWHGEYINENNEKLCLCNSEVFSPGDLLFQASGWTYEFDVSSDSPFVLHIDAASISNDLVDVDVTTNIYVNGELVATDTNRWADGATSSDFTIE